MKPQDKQRLLDWCNKLDKIQSFNRSRTSYGLKHIYEKTGGYVTNGEFKGAMLAAGFKVREIRALNWCFNVSEKSIKNIKKLAHQASISH